MEYPSKDWSKAFRATEIPLEKPQLLTMKCNEGSHRSLKRYISFEMQRERLVSKEYGLERIIGKQMEGNPLNGIELYYDEELSEKDGLIREL